MSIRSSPIAARFQQTYRLHGLRVRSDLVLPQYSTAESGGEDVVFEYGRVRETLDGGRKGAPLQIRGGQVLITVPRVGRYLIRDGREIRIDPLPSATLDLVRLYLTGSSMGALLHQRGLLPLHASAVLWGSEAIGFMGGMGAGKSTVSSWLHGAGHTFMGDDVSVVSMENDGRAWLRPGSVAARLCEDAVEFVKPLPADVLEAGTHRGKSLVRMQRSRPLAVPLKALFLLDPGGPAGSEPLGPGESALALAEHTYRRRVLRLMGGAADHLSTCVAVARVVPVHRLRRMPGLDRLVEMSDVIERILQAGSRSRMLEAGV